jgi:hypothetical protein
MEIPGFVVGAAGRPKVSMPRIGRGSERQMRTPEVTREFRDKCYELSKLSNIPQVKLRLLRLGVRYDRYLKEIDVESHSIVPDKSTDADERADVEPN